MSRLICHLPRFWASLPPGRGQDDQPSRQPLFMSQANTQGGRHICPHVTDGGAQGGTRGQGQGLRGSLPQAGVGPGAAGQGVTSVSPSLLLPQEGPRHGQMVLRGGVPWASNQPDPTAPRADLVALSLRPAPPPQPGRHCAPWENNDCGFVAALRSSLFPAAEEGRSLGRLHCTDVRAGAQGAWGPPEPHCW